ncbi:MAG: rod shape-determining protein RodA [Actinomycetota bacterium]
MASESIPSDRFGRLSRAKLGHRVSRIGRQRVREPGLSASSPIRHLDPALILSAMGLCVIGVIMIYSASFSRLQDAGSPKDLLMNRQILFLILGTIAGVAAAVIPYRRFRSWSAWIYGIGFLLLIAVLSGLGSTKLGAQRWINVGPLQLQPSEIMKVGVILLMAAVLSSARGAPTFGDVVRAVLIVIVPGVLIFKQPDLGTLLVLLALLFGLLLVAGTKVPLLLLMLAIGCAGTFGVLHMHILKSYQQARLTAFLDPKADPKVTGYNLHQSAIAVGSGGITGTGLFKGTQTNLDFVPEQHTDFIFTAVGEETGFVGSAVLLALFVVFLWRGVRIAMLSKDLFGTLIASGIVAMITFQVFVNIGMTIGLSPITGIPLPFVSYGGSSLITNFIATGLLLNVHMRRHGA